MYDAYNSLLLFDLNSGSPDMEPLDFGHYIILLYSTKVNVAANYSIDCVV